MHNYSLILKKAMGLLARRMADCMPEIVPYLTLNWNYGSAEEIGVSTGVGCKLSERKISKQACQVKSSNSGSGKVLST